MELMAQNTFVTSPNRALPNAKNKGGMYSDIAQVIYERVGKQSETFAYHIAKNLQELSDPTTGELYLTGTLHNEWKYGPNATGWLAGKSRAEFSYDKQKVKAPIKLKRKKYKKKGTLDSNFYVHNNVPYLQWLNNGYIFGTYTGAYENFIEIGIALGREDAIKEIARLRM